MSKGCVPFGDWIWSLRAALSARVLLCGLGECCQGLCYHNMS